jgi:ribosomal protein S6--L-glutamate ligase
MKIGILGWDHGRWDRAAPSLLAHGRERGHEMSLCTLEEVRYVPGQHGPTVLLGDQDATSFDAVISRANLIGDGWASDQLHDSTQWRDRVERITMVDRVLGPRLFDPIDVRLTGASKFLMAQRLAEGGFPVPPFRSVSTVEDVDAALADWSDVIVKPSYGLRGIDVERVTNLSEQRELVDSLLTRYGTLICQPFYPTQFGEFRITVAGEVTPINMLKLPPVGSWRCKTLEGASFERFDAPDDLIDLAVRATRHLGMTLSGLDVLPVPDGYMILEVNPVPGFLDIFGERAHQESLAGIFDWVEKQLSTLQ